jgi:hypothetical protein
MGAGNGNITEHAKGNSGNIILTTATAFVDKINNSSLVVGKTYSFIHKECTYDILGNAYYCPLEVRVNLFVSETGQNIFEGYYLDENEGIVTIKWGYFTGITNPLYLGQITYSKTGTGLLETNFSAQQCTVDTYLNPATGTYDIDAPIVYPAFPDPPYVGTVGDPWVQQFELIGFGYNSTFYFKESPQNQKAGRNTFTVYIEDSIVDAEAYNLAKTQLTAKGSKVINSSFNRASSGVANVQNSILNNCHIVYVDGLQKYYNFSVINSEIANVGDAIKFGKTTGVDQTAYIDSSVLYGIKLIESGATETTALRTALVGAVKRDTNTLSYNAYSIERQLSTEDTLAFVEIDQRVWRIYLVFRNGGVIANTNLIFRMGTKTYSQAVTTGTLRYEILLPTTFFNDSANTLWVLRLDANVNIDYSKSSCKIDLC